MNNKCVLPALAAALLSSLLCALVCLSIGEFSVALFFIGIEALCLGLIIKYC